MQNESKNKPDNYPLQLALKTRICLMAALIYGGTDCPVKDSVSKAVEISKEVDTQVREMKAREHE